MHAPMKTNGSHASLATPPAVQRRKARFWDKTAPKYASQAIADMAGYERTLQRVQGLLSAEHNVLELGCGTGTTALRLAAGTRRLLATDISAQMIAIAQAKLANQPIAQLQFSVADADAPAVENGAYDAVLAFNMLHLVDDLAQTLSAASQALKPGGLLISKTPCLNEMNPLIAKLAVPLMRAVGKAPPVLCFNAAQLQAAMKHQGLEILAVERHGSKGKDFRVFIVARKP